MASGRGYKITGGEFFAFPEHAFRIFAKRYTRNCSEVLNISICRPIYVANGKYICRLFPPLESCAGFLYGKARLHAAEDGVEDIG